MKCKNCQNEFEKGKFCPECAAPVDNTPAAKTKAEQAWEDLQELKTQVHELVEDKNERKERRRKYDEERSNAGKSTRKGILDIF